MRSGCGPCFLTRRRRGGRPGFRCGGTRLLPHPRHGSRPGRRLLTTLLHGARNEPGRRFGTVFRSRLWRCLPRLGRTSGLRLRPFGTVRLRGLWPVRLSLRPRLLLGRWLGRPRGRRTILRLQRFCGHRIGGPSMIHRRELRTIRGELPGMIHLLRNRRCTPVMQYRGFLRQRSNFEAAGSAVIADPVIGHIRDLVVINVPDVGVHVGNRAVVIEMALIPVTAVIAMPGIAEAVIDSAVESDMVAPVSGVPDIAATVEAPVRGSPERIDIGGDNPCAGNPVISFGSVAPVTGIPDVVVAGSGWLTVFRQRRRGLGSFYRLLLSGVAGIHCVIGIGSLIIRIRSLLHGSSRSEVPVRRVARRRGVICRHLTG